MKLSIVILLFLGLVSAAWAQERVLLARFEQTDLAVERPAGEVVPVRVVTLYRSAADAGPLSEFVEVETTVGDRTATSRLSEAAAGQLLDLFDEVSLPDIDYQKHFEALAKTPPESRRGMAWLPEGGGARRESIELHARGRTVCFEIWSPEVCLYSHPSDETARLVQRLIDGCCSAIGSGVVF